MRRRHRREQIEVIEDPQPPKLDQPHDPNLRRLLRMLGIGSIVGAGAVVLGEKAAPAAAEKLLGPLKPQFSNPPAGGSIALDYLSLVPRASRPIGIPQGGQWLGTDNEPKMFDGTNDTFLRHPVYDLRTFGAKFDGVTDDTAAWNAVFAQMSSNLKGNASARIVCPNGVSIITSPLIYAGDPAVAIHLVGSVGGGDGIALGSTIKYTGPSTSKAVLILWGAKGSTFSNFNVNANGLAKYGIWLASNTGFQTILGTAVSPGSATCTPASMSGIAVGTLLLIDYNTANAELVLVTAATGTTFTATFAKSHGSSAQVGGGSETADCEIHKVGVNGASGVGSADIALGNVTSAGGPTSSVADIRFYELESYGLNISEAGIKVLVSGNCKDFNIYGGTIRNHTKYGVDFLLGSGTLGVYGTQMLEQQIADFIIGSTNQVILLSIESESATGHKFVDSSGGNPGNPNSLTIIGCSYQSPGPANDYVISYAGALTLIGNQFNNSRTGSSVAKVQQYNDPRIVGGIAPSGDIFSIGNYFQNAPSGWAPFYDGNDNTLLPAYYANQSLAVTSLNDYGGAIAALVRLNNYLAINRLVSAASAKVASIGVLAVGNTDVAAAFRNNADSGDVMGLSKDTSDIVRLGDAPGGKASSMLLIGGSNLFSGSGVPAGGLGVNGDIYFRTDGGAGTTMYQKRSGSWVATGA